MPSREKLAEFTAWCRKNVTGDEKGQAQIFLDRLFQAFGQPGCLDVGGATEFRLRKSDQDGGGTAFADYVWKSAQRRPLRPRRRRPRRLRLFREKGPARPAPRLESRSRRPHRARRARHRPRRAQELPRPRKTGDKRLH